MHVCYNSEDGTLGFGGPHADVALPTSILEAYFENSYRPVMMAVAVSARYMKGSLMAQGEQVQSIHIIDVTLQLGLCKLYAEGRGCKGWPVCGKCGGHYPAGASHCHCIPSHCHCIPSHCNCIPSHCHCIRPGQTMQKICSKCHKKKHRREFFRKGDSGLQSYCKPCKANV